jgi:hypothetical protein
VVGRESQKEMISSLGKYVRKEKRGVKTRCGDGRNKRR